MTEQKRLILASASPRRLELLRAAGIEPVICPADAEELSGGLPPKELVIANACLKAEAAAVKFPQSVIVAADTVVALDGEIFGKPKDEAAAILMLQRLSGRTHSVFTGVAVYQNGELFADAAESKVSFRELTAEEIAAYAASGEPLDKAGAYAIQGGAASFVRNIEGDRDNIVGLPLRLLASLLPLAEFR